MSAPVIFAYGAHGHDVAAIYWRVHTMDIVCYDDDPALEMLPPASSYWLPCYVCTYNPRERARMAEKQTLLGATPLIDPSAVVGDDCDIGRGGVIGPMSSLLTNVILGQHCHVGYHVGMTRCTIGAFSTISPGAIICGDTTIGKEAFIGAGAVISNLVTIGDRCTVGAGAVVTPFTNVPDDATVVGVPARIVS